MPWWGWVITGTVLLGAEMFGISAEFYLVFLGAAAIVVGLLGAAGLVLPAWGQWLAFAFLAATTMVVFRRRLYRRFRDAGARVDERLELGSHIVVPTQLEPGGSCRVEYRGTTWTALNDDERPIAAGTRAVISAVSGFTLHLRNPVADHLSP
jgi:membrane protein implicated in regulation of membrane protease activity